METPSSLKVNEIFFSIQGEGTRSGVPCVFVRLHGCGLRCTYCDTPYALDHKVGGKWMGVSTLVDKIAEYPTRFVEFTGGEPLEQPEIHSLISRLLDMNYIVAIETGGHIDISSCDPRSIRILDLKTPDSGMMKKNRWENIQDLRQTDEVKFVCASRSDYEWSRSRIEEYSLTQRVGAVLLSPVFGVLEPVHLAEWILADGLQVRMQLQLHKYIWDPTMRGV